jgi:nucleotide-binding universal stress UspA family protein
MLEIKSIVCPVDFSEFSVRAYHHAVSLAEHYRAKLVAQHIIELSHYPYADYAASAGDYENFSRAMREGGKEQLREFVKKHTQSETQPEFVVSQGTAPDSILAFAQEQKMDLIVMGTHGRRGFDRLMLGTTTDRVMRRSICPVLAVSQTPPDTTASEERRHVHHLDRIVFCTDFSENSERALHYAISATREYDAELTMLHVLESANSARKEEIMSKILTTAAGQLDKLIPAEERKRLKIKTEVRVGEPYQQIIQHAEEAKIDLVVMAVRGRGALDLAVFGSTTYRVMQLGPCPVLAVHI